MRRTSPFAIPVFHGSVALATAPFRRPDVSYGVAKALVVLNLLDAVFTLYWVRTGLAEEANAFIRDLVDNNALGFVLAKIALVSLGALVLWRNRWHRLADAALTACCGLYFLVVLYHLRFSGALLLN